MTLAFLALGAALLVLPGLGVLRLDRLGPGYWSWLAATSLRAGLGLAQVALALGAAPTLLRATGVPDAAALCHRIFGSLGPETAVAGWLSAAASAWVLLARTANRARRRRLRERATIEPWIGEHTVVEGVEAVRIPVLATLAYAIPGRRPQVVTSEGLHRLLTPEELDAVVRHELSHLAHGHDRPLALASAVEAVFGGRGPAARSAANLRLALERVADEDAGPVVPGRDHLRAALAKAAGRGGPDPAAVLPAFAPLDTVTHRLEALATASTGTHWPARALASLPVLATMATAAMVVATWSLAAHHQVLGLSTICLT